MLRNTCARTWVGSIPVSGFASSKGTLYLLTAKLLTIEIVPILHCHQPCMCIFHHKLAYFLSFAILCALFSVEYHLLLSPNSVFTRFVTLDKSI